MKLQIFIASLFFVSTAFSDGKQILTLGENALILYNTQTISEKFRSSIQLNLNPSNYKPKVDRSNFLSQKYIALTKNKSTDEDKILAVLSYLQQHMIPPRYPPLDKEQQLITDPLLLDDLRLAGCGQTAKLLVDLLTAGGHQARVLQLNGHVASAVYLEGAWRFLDADTQAFSQVPRNLEGKIATVKELHENLALTFNIPLSIKLDAFLKERHQKGLENINTYGSLKVFQRTKIGEYETPYFYEKNTKDPGFTLENKYYGWNYYRVIPINFDKLSYISE